MGTLTRLATGDWRGRVRRGGLYASATFQRKANVEMKAREVERAADDGERARKLIE